MLRRTAQAITSGTNSIDDTVVVLPDGLSQIVSLKGLENFSDLKCRLELLYGIPYELQRVFLSDTEHSVGDWVPLNTLHGEKVVFVKTEKSLLTFISACLRQHNETVLQILDGMKNAIAFENRIFIALLISFASTNKELIKILLNETVNDFNILNKRTASGRNLLHVAAASQNWECTELILKYVNSNLLLAEDCSGQTPLSTAEHSHNQKFIQNIREYFTKQKMENSKNTNKKEVTRHRESQSLKLNLDRQLKITEKNTRSQSTPTSPFEKSNNNHRLLERQTLTNSFDNLEDANKSKFKGLASSSKKLPALELGTYDSKFLNPEVAMKKSPRSVSPSPPRNSPINNSSIRRTSTQSISAPVSPSQIKPSSRMFQPPSTATSDERNSGLSQVVFLPPWRSNGGNTLDGGRHEIRRISIANTKPVTYYEYRERRESTVICKRPSFRSLSVACKLTADDLERLENQERLSRPWNEWRRLSVAPKTEPQISPKDRTGSKKSFEEWFLDKENEKEAGLAKMSEEEQQKALDKDRQEQERRTRCKSYDQWLLEKEIEVEILKEDEKEKENEKQINDDKMKERKAEAERKYQKWMMEKYEEELRKEEELEKLMQEKWKLKQKTQQARRKSIATTKLTGKSPLTASKSLPIV